MSFSLKERQTLLLIAKQAITDSVLHHQPADLPEDLPSALTIEDGSGAFVTIYLSGKLRGCIGLLESNLSIAATVQAMAKAAALDDPRFTPVRREEVDRLAIEISIISPKKPIESIDQIKLGRDGIVISGRGRQGVFLPQVATETGWDVKTFLSECCEHKAGLPRLAWQESDVLISTFQADIIKEKESPV